MCGRYSLSSPGDLVAEVFGLPAPPELSPRFNIAPTQEAPVVRRAGPGRERTLDHLRWGFVPHWADDPGIGARMINARAETAAHKPAFRDSFRSRRCLAVADGFYEWRRTDGRKQPFFLRREDGRPFGIAALWDRWADPVRGDLETFTILTTGPNELVAPLHDRMPVLLRQRDHDLWLDPAMADQDRLEALLEPYGGDELVAYPVSTYVNDPANDSHRCIQPLTT